MSGAYILTETRMGESTEIGIRNQSRDLIAVITRPCPGAKWFLHWANDFRTNKFKTKKAAIQAAIGEK